MSQCQPKLGNLGVDDLYPLNNKGNTLQRWETDRLELCQEQDVLKNWQVALAALIHSARTRPR